MVKKKLHVGKLSLFLGLKDYGTEDRSLIWQPKLQYTVIYGGPSLA